MSFILVARCTDEHTELHRQRLESLYDHDQEVTRRTFFQAVSLRDVSELLGYAYGRWQRGVHLMKDWHLQFYRSQWRGVPCLHLEWSAIDHVFVRESDIDRMSDRQIQQ